MDSMWAIDMHGTLALPFALSVAHFVLVLPVAAAVVENNIRLFFNIILIIE